MDGLQRLRLVCGRRLSFFSEAPPWLTLLLCAAQDKSSWMGVCQPAGSQYVRRIDIKVGPSSRGWVCHCSTVMLCPPLGGRRCLPERLLRSDGLCLCAAHCVLMGRHPVLTLRRPPPPIPRRSTPTGSPPLRSTTSAAARSAIAWGGQLGMPGHGCRRSVCLVAWTLLLLCCLNVLYVPLYPDICAPACVDRTSAAAAGSGPMWSAGRRRGATTLPPTGTSCPTTACLCGRRRDGGPTRRRGCSAGRCPSSERGRCAAVKGCEGCVPAATAGLSSSHQKSLLFAPAAAGLHVHSGRLAHGCSFTSI